VPSIFQAGDRIIDAGTAPWALPASRWARNGRDRHTLIEFCGLVGMNIVHKEDACDPRHPNDRLLLGMKGTMSDLELSLGHLVLVPIWPAAAGKA